ncbi:translocase [Roseivivax sp. GX 12232]|uniref:translocase n=1 Tax=Roseivivax sp. GX 12232 TaxID=2900547 RepID=UPI001E3E5444|nr:translocase [Roseivivax sp. GX 12232]MCE0505709.1 translocase [Roseivivax sp. GX 12232]
MALSKTYALAAGTVASAFAIGYVMQFGLPGLGTSSDPIAVSGITDTAAPAGASATGFGTSGSSLLTGSGGGGTAGASLVAPGAPGNSLAASDRGVNASGGPLQASQDTLKASPDTLVALGAPAATGANAGFTAKGAQPDPTATSATAAGETTLASNAQPNFEGRLLPRDSAASPALGSERSATVGAASATGNGTRDGAECAIQARAETSAAAMVSLTLEAPCHGAERVTLHHSGLMFTATTKPDGSLSLEVPALSETAVFIFSFAGGAGAVAQTEVSSLSFYDRVALQWRGDAGLGLHAREGGAEYFAPGHIWSGAPGEVATAARGEGGFLVRLGDAGAPEPLLAEIYSFPAGMVREPADVAISVEAEVTTNNCSADVEAQTLERRVGAELSVRDLRLSVPACDAVGDFLVLDALVRDIEVAAR